MATLEQRRKADRIRFKRWRKKKLSEGNKQIQLMLIPEAHEFLEYEKKRSGESYVQIVNRAILSLKDISLDFPMKKREERELEHQATRDLILKMDKEGKNHSQISKLVNDEGIPTFSGSGK